MFRNRRRLLLRSALLLGLALIACVPASAEDPAAPAAKVAQKAKPPVVTVTEARKISFVDNILVTGSLAPREEVLVGPEIDGYRVTELLAEEGDHVQKGQALAKLSREILEAQLAQAPPRSEWTISSASSTDCLAGSWERATRRLTRQVR